MSPKLITSVINPRKLPPKLLSGVKAKSTPRRLLHKLLPITSPKTTSGKFPPEITSRRLALKQPLGDYHWQLPLENYPSSTPRILSLNLPLGTRPRNYLKDIFPQITPCSLRRTSLPNPPAQPCLTFYVSRVSVRNFGMVSVAFYLNHFDFLFQFSKLYDLSDEPERKEFLDKYHTFMSSQGNLRTNCHRKQLNSMIIVVKRSQQQKESPFIRTDSQSFHWSQSRISFTDSKGRTTLCCLFLGVKKLTF